VAIGVPSGIGTAYVRPWYIYGDGSSFVLAGSPETMIGTVSGYGGVFILERARNVDGTPLADGAHISWINGTALTTYGQSLLFHTLTPQLGQGSFGWVPSVLAAFTPSTGVIGSNMYILPYFTGFTPRLGAPSKMVVGTIKADMPAGNTFTLTHYGESATFVAISPSGAYVLGMGAATNIGLGIRIA
jgi:hypothetical protein